MPMWGVENSPLQHRIPYRHPQANLCSIAALDWRLNVLPPPPLGFTGGLTSSNVFPSELVIEFLFTILLIQNLVFVRPFCSFFP